MALAGHYFLPRNTRLRIWKRRRLNPGRQSVIHGPYSSFNAGNLVTVMREIFGEASDFAHLPPKKSLLASNTVFSLV